GRRHDFRGFLRRHRAAHEALISPEFPRKNPRIFVRTLLSHPCKARCSDYRATQKSRGWLEPGNSGLTTLGSKNEDKGMQNTGQGSEKKSYRVILLLVVGLAAFSSAMKELNQVHALTLQTSELIAQWTDAIAPAEQHAILALAKVESCENSQIVVPPPPPLPA